MFLLIGVQFTMGLRFTVLLCLLLAGVYAQAAKMYKIVDAEGNVTFSQFPPAPQAAQGEDKVKVKEMSVSGESSSQVRSVGKKQYCGEIELPLLNPKKPETYLDLGEYRHELSRELDGDTDLNDVRFRLHMNRYNLSRDPSAAGQRKRDLQCAIQWVDKQKADVEKVRADLKQEQNQLQQKITRIQADRDKRCGSEPYRDPNQPATNALWERWSDCFYEYQDELYDLEYKASQVQVD